MPDTTVRRRSCSVQPETPESSSSLAFVLSSLGTPSLRLCRHRSLQILIHFVEKARRREPFLVGADEKREILRHVAGLDRVDADLLQRRREAGEGLVVVELRAMREAAGPGEDRGDRVGRGLL